MFTGETASILGRRLAGSRNLRTQSGYGMKQSGSKLVLGLVCLAVLAGVVSWSYRYATTHRATQFWGREAAPLIAQPSQVEFARLVPSRANSGVDQSEILKLGMERSYLSEGARDVTHERGLVHLRHALLSDRGFVWSDRPDPREVEWQWLLKFFDEESQAFVLLSEDLASIGLVVEGESSEVSAVSCQPMADTLRHYFDDVGFSSASTSE